MNAPPPISLKLADPLLQMLKLKAGAVAVPTNETFLIRRSSAAVVATGADQEADVPPLVPVHVHVHGPVPVTSEAVPVEQMLLAGLEVTAVPLAVPQTPFIAFLGAGAGTGTGLAFACEEVLKSVLLISQRSIF